MTVRRWTLVATAAALLSGCTHPVPGQPVAAEATASTTASSSAPAPASLPDAASLLLPSGSTTPVGTATQTFVGANYYTSADPASCAAAVLFKNSPLIPAGSVQHAESGYTLNGTAMMAESADTYIAALDVNKLRLDAFSAVSSCSGGAVGISPLGTSPSMRLTQFAMGDGTVVWSMLQSGWNCDYAMIAVPHAVVMLSMCDATAGFAMSDWADQRRAQLLTQMN